MLERNISLEGIRMTENNTNEKNYGEWRKEMVTEEGKHIVTEQDMATAKLFFEWYKEDMSPEEMKARYAGMYGKMRETPMPRRKLERIWDLFLQEERRDFIISHNTMSISEILRIGIDKFVMTLGWEKVSDVATWRNNVVRIGICPECKEQFIPLMFQTNQGLCNNCRPNFSVKAIRRFMEYVIAKNDRYENAHHDALMDFYIMFYNDELFRKLFVKGTDSANQFETQEYELPDWYLKVQEKEEARLNKQMQEMVPEQDA